MNDSRSRPTAALILGIFVALGLTLSGFFVARAVETAKTFERFVTVKGLSEREVKPPAFRYSAAVTTLLRSTRVEDVRKAMEGSDRLVQDGVALSGSDYSGRAEFFIYGNKSNHLE